MAAVKIPDVRHPGGMRALPYPDSLREKHTALTIITHPDDSISYPDILSGWKEEKRAHIPPPTDGVSGRPVRMIAYPIRTALHCFAMDSKELSSILDCFGDQITNKKTKTYTIWLEMIAKVLNMLIGLKGNNYYSKVFKIVNYKLWNSTFWVVINEGPHASTSYECTIMYSAPYRATSDQTPYCSTSTNFPWNGKRESLCTYQGIWRCL